MRRADCGGIPQKTGSAATQPRTHAASCPGPEPEVQLSQFFEFLHSRAISYKVQGSVGARGRRERANLEPMLFSITR